MDTESRDTYYNLTGLQQNTLYYIRVVAVNYMTFGGAPMRGDGSETITASFRPSIPASANGIAGNITINNTLEYHTL